MPTLRDEDQPFVYDVKLFNRPYRFEFSDTKSPTSWSLLQPGVVVLCYDISQRLSLINLQRVWSKSVSTFANHNTLPVLMLGLKRDLRSENDPNGIIYPQESYRIAQELRCDRYMECSALTGELVAECWEDICRTAASTASGHGGQSEGGCGIM